MHPPGHQVRIGGPQRLVMHIRDFGAGCRFQHQALHMRAAASAASAEKNGCWFGLRVADIFLKVFQREIVGDTQHGIALGQQ